MRAALEEGTARLVLDLGDGAVQGGLRQPEAAGCKREILGIGQRDPRR